MELAPIGAYVFFYTWKHVWNTTLFEYLYEIFPLEDFLFRFTFHSSKEHKQLWYKNLIIHIFSFCLIIYVYLYEIFISINKFVSSSFIHN
jgi:hypothetical protein